MCVLKQSFINRTNMLQMCATTVPTQPTTTNKRHENNENIDLPELTIPLAIIQDPCRLFMAIRFNFATSKDVPIESVRFKGIFCDKSEMEQKGADNRTGEKEPWYQKMLDIEEGSREYVIALSGLILQGVNWDYER